MFIELTDHLRCPTDHDESYLVLLPDTMEGRSVKSGQLGCPVCGRAYEIVEGVFQAGDPPRFQGAAQSALDTDAIHTLVGLGGPGGYMVLVGGVGAVGPEVARLNPGVALVAVNPGTSLPDLPELSVVRSSRIPLKSRSMRSAVLGPGYADDPFWIEEAARVVLPGRRVVGEGSDPAADTIDLMASAGGVWVGTGAKSVSGKR
jgi:uncharacterized protein YbaR (Trm112 family)